MSDEGFAKNGAKAEQPTQSKTSPDKKWWRPLVVLIGAFVCLQLILVLTQNRETINWVEDYEAGIKLAKEQNKPVLLAFYKQNTGFSEVMSRNTYTNGDVIKYVEDNFVPILIDVDKRPEIAKRYNINYYPTHYVKAPDSDELIGPQMGYDVPVKFITILENYLARLNKQGE